MSQSNVAPIAPPIQSWSLDPITATRATAGDLMALIAHMDGKVSVIPIEGGTNVAIFAEDPIAAVKLANWMRQYVPTATERWTTLAAISN